MSKAVLGAIAAATVLLGVATPAVAADGADVPVAGTFDYSPSRSSENGTVRGVINAVRRVPGGTVVYWSIGRQQGGQPLAAIPTLTNDVVIDTYKPADIAYVDVIDADGLKRYRPMVAAGTCLCSTTADYPSPTLPVGKLYTGYVVVPELPASVKTVTVMGFFGAAVTGVPVTDGLLEPASPQGGGIVELTTGWPTVPVDKIAQVAKPADFVQPLQARTADIANTVRKRETPTQVQVDLAADVLFATDSARLSSAATSRIAAVAKDIAARGTGVVEVTGYTDSTGGTSHNLVLSQQRAQSVLAALKPSAGSKVTFQAAGKGEAEPQAPNTTAAGRQQNRRVTITYSVSGK